MPKQVLMRTHILLLFVLMSLAKDLSICLFKEPALSFIDLFYCALISISFIFTLGLIISFLLLTGVLLVPCLVASGVEFRLRFLFLEIFVS